MATAPAIIVNLPNYPFDNFPSLGTIAALRAVSVFGLLSGDNYVIDGTATSGDGGGGVFTWNASSMATDDGVTIIKPNALTSGQAGRWVLISNDALSGQIAGKANLTNFPSFLVAPTDGTTDARPAIAALDALGKPFTVPPGLYRVSTSITIANPVEFSDGARLVIPSGVTVTFTKGIAAPLTQIFNFTGTTPVLGLYEAYFEWFAGDLKASRAVVPVMDCRAALNAFAASLSNFGTGLASSGTSVAHFGPGKYLLDGSAAWTEFRNTSLIGPSSGACTLFFPGTQTNGIKVSTDRGQVSGLQFDSLNPGTVPTAGTVLVVASFNVEFRDITISNCWNGLVVLSPSSGNTYHACRVYNAANIARQSAGVDNFFRNCTVQALSDWATVTGISGGTFNAGDAVSIAGGSGVITSTHGGGLMKITWYSPRPTPPLAITNTTTSATGTLSVNTPGHKTAAFLIQSDGVNGLGLTTDLDSDLIGGDWGLIIQGVANNQAQGNPNTIRIGYEFCVDTCYYGSKIDQAWDVMNHGWFASSRNQDAPGLVVTNSLAVFCVDGHYINNSGPGLRYDAGSSYFGRVSGCYFDGNTCNASTGTAMAELAVVGQPGAAIRDLSVSGNQHMGYTDLYGRTPVRGFYIGHTNGAAATALLGRVNLIDNNWADTRFLINGTQVNNTNQRLRISCCTGVADQ